MTNRARNLVGFPLIMTSIWQRPTWRVFLIVFAVGLTWAIATEQAWEDFYITYRASKNLAEGNGLVFSAGERVHSFTSPLGVLLPAASYLLTARQSDAVALWIFRAMCLSALGGAAVLLWNTLRRLHPASAAPAVVLVALLATDNKTIAFAINGMETAFLLLFFAWALWAIFTRPERLGLHLGLAWGGLMWTRPDSSVYIAVIGLGLLLFSPTGEGSFWARRVQWLRTIVTAGGLCAAIYLPWFIWAWSYYGSPVPHTIKAKGLFTPVSLTQLVHDALHFPQTIIAGKSTLSATFLPYYGISIQWPVAPTVSFVAALIAVVLFLVPGVGRGVRFVSFVFAVGQFYLTTVVGWLPWYIPHVALFAFVALALIFGELLKLAEGLRSRNNAAAGTLKTVLWVLVSLFVGIGAVQTVVIGRQAYFEMHLIEGQVRGAVGRWLHDQAKSSRESVFLEPLGFIGFYSGLKMLDYPGLCSPEVVAARLRATSQSYPYCWSEIIAMLRPDWLALRPFERAAIEQHDPLLLSAVYTKVKTFDSTAQINEAKWVPIRGFLNYNSVFEIYHLNHPPEFRPAAYVPLQLPITIEQMTRKDAALVVETSGLGIKAHAPSVLVVPVAGKSARLLGGFGIYEGAYANPPPAATDGAEFAITCVAPDGTRTELLRRFLDPAAIDTDRGLQQFDVALPASFKGSIEFEITAGPNGSNSYDWTYWYDPRFSLETPRAR